MKDLIQLHVALNRNPINILHVWRNKSYRLTQLLFIESFVFGAACIATIYHLVLFIQQRDKFLVYYSAYLLSLSCYIGFKLWSNNYDPFLPTTNVWHYVLEEVLQVSMVTIYVVFAAQTLEVVGERSIVRSLMYLFFVLSFLSLCYHFGDALINGAGVKTHQTYAISRISLVGIATIALLFAWRIRSSTFQRTIIIGSLVYDSSGLLSIISFTYDTTIFGLYGVEPYLLGCLLDIIIFSSALGYRLKTIADEKNELLRREIEAQYALEKTRSSIASNLHDDVGSTLSSISIYSEAVKTSLKNNEFEKAMKLVTKIGENARETISSMGDIVWNINPLNDTPDKLFIRMESTASMLFSASNILMEFEADSRLLGFDFTMDAKQNLYLIFKETVNNTVKYAEASRVKISIKKDNEFLELWIEDNGKGFDSSGNSNGNGLKNIRKRTEKLNGTATINSTPDGTCSTFRLPLQVLQKA